MEVPACGKFVFPNCEISDPLSYIEERLITPRYDYQVHRTLTMNCSSKERCEKLFAALNDLEEACYVVEADSELGEAITLTIHHACQHLMDVGYLEREEVPAGWNVP